MAGSQQGWRVAKSIGVGGVQSVSGLNTDNIDPINPVVKISVDGTTITGAGTPVSPLKSSVDGVQSVTGLNTDNTDPINPIVKISVDGTTITGAGTPVSPLKSSVDGVQSVTGLNTDNTDPINPIVKISVDGTTITGLGTPASPLQAQYIPATNYGLYSQTANSVPVTATIVERTLIGAGVGTLSVPANGFQVGDSFRADFGGLLSAQNNNTIRIRVKSGSVVLADSGVQTLPSITNDVWQLSINFTIRAIGGTGVASIVSLGVFHDVKTANGNQNGFAFNTINNTTFNTTILNTLDVTAQFSTNNANNSIYSDIFVLNKIY